jgi:thioredoxin-dependent peroxiredoxin
MATKEAIRVGDQAPDFTLPTQSGEQVSLHQFLGEKVVVLYFYPADNTAGCTKEACAFRDSYEVFTEAGAQVIGISVDSVESHEQFAAKHSLPFLLLSDQGGAVREAYGIRPTLGVIPGRVTFVIDRAGVVQYAFSSLTRIGSHVDGALATVKSLAAAAS